MPVSSGAASTGTLRTRKRSRPRQMTSARIPYPYGYRGEAARDASEAGRTVAV